MDELVMAMLNCIKVYLKMYLITSAFPLECSFEDQIGYR